MEKQFLSIKEVAAYFGVSDDTVRRMIKDNQIAFVSIRGQKKISKKNLEGWVDKNTVQKKVA